jgi:hypothetical protein
MPEMNFFYFLSQLCETACIMGLVSDLRPMSADIISKLSVLSFGQSKSASFIFLNR